MSDKTLERYLSSKSDIIVESEPDCPQCGAKLDGAYDPTDPTNSPKGGDATVCVYCESVLMYNDDLSLRKAEREDMSDEDWEYIDMMKEYLRAMKAGPQ